MASLASPNLSIGDTIAVKEEGGQSRYGDVKEKLKTLVETLKVQINEDKNNCVFFARSVNDQLRHQLFPFDIDKIKKRHIEQGVADFPLQYDVIECDGDQCCDRSLWGKTFWTPTESVKICEAYCEKCVNTYINKEPGNSVIEQTKNVPQLILSKGNSEKKKNIICNHFAYNVDTDKWESFQVTKDDTFLKCISISLDKLIPTLGSLRLRKISKKWFNEWYCCFFF